MMSLFGKFGKSSRHDPLSASQRGIMKDTAEGLRSLDDKLFNTIIDLLEVFTKRASNDENFLIDVVNHSNNIVINSKKEIDSIASSVLDNMASKKFLESATSSSILWFSFIRVLNNIEYIFNYDQCMELRDCSDDTLALISASLPLVKQNLLGAIFSCIETVGTINSKEYTFHILSRMVSTVVMKSILPITQNADKSHQTDDAFQFINTHTSAEVFANIACNHRELFPFG